MKKTLLALSLLISCGLFCSCGNTASAGDSAPETAAEAVSAAEEDNAPEEGIDYDLTTMSSTMIYSTVSNMMLYPDVYQGKTVKLEGNFSVYHDEAADRYLFAAIVPDATACCQQGIEFVLGDEYKYPDDYPEEGHSITIKGTFNTYNEYGFNYAQLLDATMAVNS